MQGLKARFCSKNLKATPFKFPKSHDNYGCMKHYIHNYLFLALTLATLFVAPHAYAQSPDYVPIQTSISDLDLIDAGEVVEVQKADLIKLKNGKYYSLDNVRVPLQMNTDATAYLKATLIGKPVGIYSKNNKPAGHTDRYGTKLVQVELEDGRWLQGEMVSEGLAWANSTLTSRDLITVLYKHERYARANKKGLWANPLYFVNKDAATLEGKQNSFQIYEGVIKSERDDKQNNHFFHFAEDRKTDFTILVKVENIGILKESDFNFKNIVGKRVRIRGWLQKTDGPMIELTHPEQIEFIEIVPAAGAAAATTTTAPVAVKK